MPRHPCPVLSLVSSPSPLRTWMVSVVSLAGSKCLSSEQHPLRRYKQRRLISLPALTIVRRWIFILEGLVPVAISFSLYFLLPDRPETASFLTKDERAFVVNRIALHTGSGAGRTTNVDKMSFSYFKDGLSDWRVYVSVIPFWACSIGTYGFTATVPTVIKAMGYSKSSHPFLSSRKRFPRTSRSTFVMVGILTSLAETANAQLLTIPIYFFATICTVVVAYFADRVQQRTPFIMGGFTYALSP
jgi:hypothetical protein